MIFRRDLETAIECVLCPGRWLVFFDYKTGGNVVVLSRQQVIEEVLDMRVSPEYFQHVRRKLERIARD
jgi:hypothetical protein